MMEGTIANILDIILIVVILFDIYVSKRNIKK